jgi:hypothetical protein
LTGVRVRRFGVEGIPGCGTDEQVLRQHGLDAGSLSDAIALALADEPIEPKIRLRQVERARGVG